VTRLRGFRQGIIDERTGVVGAHVVVEESGAPVLLVVRLKVVADKLTEIELVATSGRAEGLIFQYRRAERAECRDELRASSRTAPHPRRD
jgi:hypothetical protein